MAEQLIFTQETLVVSGTQAGSDNLADTRFSQQSLAPGDLTQEQLDSSGENT